MTGRRRLLALVAVALPLGGCGVFGQAVEDASSTPCRPQPWGLPALAQEKTPISRAAHTRWLQRGMDEHATALVLLWDGWLVTEWYAAGEAKPMAAMSVTKSVASMGLGAMITNSELDANARVGKDLPEFAASPDKENITVRQLLTHTSGITWQRTDWQTPGNVLSEATQALVASPPGSAFVYNDLGVDLAAAVGAKAANLGFDDYLSRELFGPMHIAGAFWQKDSVGTPRAGSALFMYPVDYAKLGELMRKGGEWHGRRLLSSAWVNESTAPSPKNPAYGLGWWRRTAPGNPASLLAFYAEGWLGQYIVVVPQAKLVAVRLRHPSSDEYARMKAPGYRPYDHPTFVDDVLALAGAK